MVVTMAAKLGQFTAGLTVSPRKPR